MSNAAPFALPPGLRTRNDSILERCAPFLVAAPWHRAHFDLRPFGLPVPGAHVIAPTRVDSGRFLDRLETLDRITFGPEGMPMPRWLFYEAAALPGGIFGFAAPAETLPPAVANRLEVGDGHTGLVPLSMYIAIPARPPDTWFGHNLASLNRTVPELGLHGLGSITKAFALECFRCRRLVGATQWDSPALHVHLRFGPLELLTAWTPAHGEPGTLTYRVTLTDERLRHALGDPAATVAHPPADLEVAAGDVETMQRLQVELEAGARYAIVGPPRVRPDGSVAVPVAKRREEV
jgi:hypothetical protein